MDLSTTFLGSISVNTDMLSAGQGLTKAEPAKASGQRFDSYYDNYKNNRQDDNRVDRSKNVNNSGNVSKRQDIAGNRQTPEEKQNVKNNKEKDVTDKAVNKTDDTKETKTVTKKEETGKTSDVKVTEDAETAELEKNILAEVSNALGISEEDLAAIMQELNILPAQLTQNEDVVKLVKEYLQIEDPAQLLTASNFTDIVSSVGKAVEQAVQKTEADNLNAQDLFLQQNVVTEQVTQPTKKEEPTPDATEEAGSRNTEENTKTKVGVDDAEIPAEPEDAKAEIDIVTDAADVSDSGNQQQGGMLNQNSSGGGTNMQAQQTADPTTNNVSNNIANTPQPAAAQVREAQAPQRSEAAQRMETVIQQIADKIKVDIRFDSREMNLVLKPESLGNISLKLVSENGGVAAQFIAESQRAKEIIEASMNQLKDALQQQGINVSEMSVEVGSENQNEQMRQFLNEQAKSGKRIQELLAREGFGEEVAAAEEMPRESLDESVGNIANYEA